MSLSHTEIKFNELCQLVDWKNNYSKYERDDFKKTNALVMTKFSESEIADIRELMSNLNDKLFDVIENSNFYEEIGDGDSAMDLRYQIIGEGVDSVNYYLQNPQKILEKYNNKEFRESFSGCIPYPDDYVMVLPEYYEEGVKIIKDRIAEHPFKKIIHFQTHKKILKILNEFIKGEFKNEYTYSELQDLGSVFHEFVGNRIANLWSDGKTFYGLRVKV